MSRVSARIVCVPVDKEYVDYPITFDAVLDNEKIAGELSLGFQGKLNGEALHPFVLRRDGRMDYGSLLEDDRERFGRTNIRDRRIRLGEVITVIEHDEDVRLDREYTYKIRQIVTL